MSGLLSGIIDRKSKFEAQLWSEIIGRAHDGETSYKSYYYDKIIAEDDKQQVRNTLLEMLKSNRYSLPQKGLIAYVCADIGVSDALLDVNKLRLEAKRPSFENQMLSLAHEALLRGISVRELVYENHGSKP
jgi:hypothetical protein